MSLNRVILLGRLGRDPEVRYAQSGTTVATDPENNISSYLVHSNPTRGLVSVNSSGGWTYTPGANLNGADSFQIRVTDATGLTAVQTVNVNVAAVNDAPTSSVANSSPPFSKSTWLNTWLSVPRICGSSKADSLSRNSLHTAAARLCCAMPSAAGAVP